MAKLEVKHLTISFRTNNGAVRAVRDISFSLNEGETLAIAGESGSGKSVTTRAVMGILAGNAMVDGGEIIYDGRDLLKIPEEEFHTLRGHRLSMVFQDPLSALNPIMRIGKQLTEAMILNNKERRADGKKRLKQMLDTLRKTLKASGSEDAVKQIDLFEKFTDTVVKLEFDYRQSKESITEISDSLEEMDEVLVKKRYNEIFQIAKRIPALLKIRNDYLLPEGTQKLNTASDRLILSSKALTASSDMTEFNNAYRELNSLVRDVLNAEEPDFFSIGYLTEKGSAPDPKTETIQSINARAAKIVEDEFMNGFRNTVADALKASSEKAAAARSKAVETLKTENAVFNAVLTDKKACIAAANRAAEAVSEAIDPLELQKDNIAYVFKGSMLAAIDRYFVSLKQNPSEQKRFAKETAAREKALAAGKIAASVVPMNLIDTGAVQKKLQDTMNEIISHFEQPQDVIDASHKAETMIEYLKNCASDSAFRLTYSMAKRRAIELMKEVGIPEPRKRYTQYPFEFSGGMRQRIVIAIALSANPDILICDEPTTALDVSIQAQILELINRLKKERKLSVIFITHDLGVVANMADHIAIMYAGKIVEHGTADEVFYDPRHPYTWALLSSMPDLETKEKLEAIPGTPPDMIIPPQGDAFAARNKYAMAIDFEEQPPMFRISETHEAATWLLHPDAPEVKPPMIVTDRIARMKREQELREATAKGGENV